MSVKLILGKRGSAESSARKQSSQNKKLKVSPRTSLPSSLFGPRMHDCSLNLFLFFLMFPYKYAKSNTAGNNTNTEIKEGPWTSKDDHLLLEAVKNSQKETNSIKWKLVALDVPGRSGKQARERWSNHLNPALKKTPFSKAENMLLKELHREFGNKWVKISNRMPGRSDNEVKNKFNSVYYRLSFQIAPLAKQPKRKRQKKKTRKNEKEPMKPKKTIASVPGSTLSISAMSSSSATSASSTSSTSSSSSSSSTSSTSSSSSTSYNAGSDRASDKPIDTILGTLLPSLLLSPVYTPPVSSNITARSTNTSHNSGGGTHTIKI